jgi:hypothetical protein
MEGRSMGESKKGRDFRRDPVRFLAAEADAILA